MSEKNSKNILLGVTASISAYRACDLITELREAGYRVRVAMSKDAHHFVTALTTPPVNRPNSAEMPAVATIVS